MHIFILTTCYLSGKYVYPYFTKKMHEALIDCDLLKENWQSWHPNPSLTAL